MALGVPPGADAPGPVPSRLPPSPPAPVPPPPAAGWQVRLFGAVEARCAAQVLQRWPSRAVAALLARLAMAPDAAHAREELIELLWPGVALDVGRNRLRQALSTLKNLLESPQAGIGGVLVADRRTVRVLPGRLDSDVARFERQLRHEGPSRAQAPGPGEFMPGHYEEWVQEERRRLQVLIDRVGEAQPQGPPSRPVPAPAAVDPLDLAAAALPSGLPHYWTRPFGVELIASRLRALVRSHRLVTVVGPGGSGKTRLAVEVGQSLQETPDWSVDGEGSRFDRIVFVPLVPCDDAAQALDALCAVLRIDRGERDPLQRLLAALAGQRVLLLLDNVEQIAGPFPDLVARLLGGLPALHLLVTSRRLLELDGETAFELDGLPLPTPEAAWGDVLASPAVALFADRARAARSDFRLTAANAPEVTALVRLLAGMPLAIELAASRVRTLSAQELLARLQAGAGTPMLDLLSRGAQRPSADTRHASMRHVVAWSWRQLKAQEVAMAQTLSVFVAPACIEAVAAASGQALPDAEAGLAALHDASLVRRLDDVHGRRRWMLLEPVREFAAERSDPAQARQARQRLRLWLIGFAREAVKQGPAAVAPELAHVHAAILTARADGASRHGLALAVALRDHWDADLPPATVLEALGQALDDVDDPALRCDVLELLSFGSGSNGAVREAQAHADAAVAAAPDDRRRSLALSRQVWALYAGGQLQADLDTPLAEAVRLAERAGDPAALAIALRLQGVMRSNLRMDYAGAEVLLERVQQLWESVGHRQNATWAMLNRAVMWVWMGRVDEGLAAHEACERLAIADGNWISMMGAARQIGRIQIRQGRPLEAAQALRRSLRVAAARHHVQYALHALLHLSHALALGDDIEAAARLHAFSTAHWARVYGALNPIEAREMRRARRLLRARLGAVRMQSLTLEAVGLTLAQATALGLAEGAGPA